MSVVEYKQNGLNFLGGYLDKDEIINLVTNEKVYWYRNEMQFLITKPLEGFIGFDINNYLRLFRNEKLEYCAYDININEIKQVFKLKFNGQYPAVYHNFNLIFHEFPYSILSSQSLLTGEQDWELDLGGRSYQFGGETIEDKIVSVIGVSEAGKLAVSLQSENLVCVDVATGHILWESKQLVANIPNLMAVGQLGFSARGFNHHWHLNSEKLYHLNANSYFSVDLLDGSIEVLWQSEPNWCFRQTLFMDDFVYFVGTNKSAFHTHLLGVFNRKTLKIDWFQDLELGISETTHYNVNINSAPQYGAGKLYVLDTGGTLHIFENMNS